MENRESRDLKSLPLDLLKEKMTELSEKPFRAKQLYDWMHVKLAGDYDEMTNLSAAFRNRLKEEYPLTTLRVVREQTSAIDGTKKFLFALPDGNLVESVWMQYKHGNSVCISSQVGCRMGCRFCASTLNGKVRDLRPSEMLDQIYRIQKITGERVSNVVVMGSGEPMDNYDNLIKFIELLNDERGLNISQRNITVSSCGIVPKLKELADLKLQITLAISLHAPNDELRKTMMPIANKYSIEEIMDVCRYYIECTGRRISFEYSLVKGVNDSMECAKQLIELVKGMNCHINLIPVNPSLNASKRDKLPNWDRYFLSFAQNQFRLNQMVYKYERLAHIFRECQRDSLNAAWSVEELYVKNIKNDQFCKVLESRLKPIYELARTQGYRIWMVGE